MHIGFLTPEYVSAASPDGGLANYLKKIGTSLVDRGNHVTIFRLSDKNSEWFDDEIRIIEIEREKQNSPLKSIPLLRQFLACFNQTQNSRKIAQEVMRLHCEKPLDIIQQSTYLSLGNALLHNHTIPLVCRASSYSPFWRSAYGRPRSPADWFSEGLELRQMRESDAAYSPSNFIAGVFTVKTGRKIPVIRTPVGLLSAKKYDFSFFNQHLSGRKYLLFFGTLSRIKGVDLIADVISPVVQRYPDIFFVFIGRDDGLPGGRRIKDLIIEHSGAYMDHVFLHPAIPKIQLYPVILNATGILMPSRVDNYPNACLEAQHFGIPVIGSENSSLEEMIHDNKTGFLAKNSDFSSLKNSIIKLLDMSPSELEEMKKNIRIQVEHSPDEDMVNQLLDFYRNTIAGFREKTVVPPCRQ